MDYQIAGVSHTGNRRKNNQDRILFRTGQCNGVACALLAVADGMGGLSCGEKASAIVVELLAHWWDSFPFGEEETQKIGDALDAVIYEAHRRIYDLSEEIGEKMGTTLSLLYLQQDRYLIKQIGDSRVYCLEGSQLRQMTADQTWGNRMVASGVMSEEEARCHRQWGALVNALGISPELEIVTSIGTAPEGSCFLVCSDGFYREASLEHLEVCLQTGSPQSALEQLEKQVLARAAADNLSAILCRLVKSRRK